jgi:phasin family protein
MVRATDNSHVAQNIQGAAHEATVSAQAVVEAQRRNFEALAQASQIAFEGLQTVLRRQTEIAHQTANDFSLIFQDLLQPNGSPAERFARQAEHSKEAIERGITHARELAELATKAGTDAFDVVARRVSESLSEVGDFAAKRTGSR